VEFISQMTRPFCADCRRLRIDAKGRLKACLLSGQHLDLRGLLRGGADDATVAESVRSFVLAAEKRLAEDPHHWEARAAALTMNEIGG
jgi:cyclic pyranopterin phosphate synthase